MVFDFNIQFREELGRLYPSESKEDVTELLTDVSTTITILLHGFNRETKVLIFDTVLQGDIKVEEKMKELEKVRAKRLKKINL